MDSLSMKEYPEVFGIYRYFGRDGDGALVWKLLDSTKKRYIVRVPENDNWQVHDHVDASSKDTAYISSFKRDGNVCPVNSNHDEWRYYNNTRRYFENDKSIQIRCAD